MKLVIAEKPSVARSIAAVIGANEKHSGYIEGNGYIVSWCIGHLVGLYSPNDYDEKYIKYSFDLLPIIPDEFKFKLNENTKDQFQVLKSLMSRSDVDELVCATDAGREGECIFRYVYNFAGCKKPFKRLWISSVEDKAIHDGFASLKNSSDYDPMFAAGLSRSKADWLVGMNFSRVFSCRYGTKLSVGRVQTPTLAMIVKRDSDIKNFVKQKYFTIELDCGKLTVSSNRIDDETIANDLVNNCNGKTATVTSVEKSVKKLNPPKLYDLTTLQREANRQYGYTAQQTLDYTQELYENKLVTYPRTDSQYLTEDMEQTAVDMIQAIYTAIPDFKPVSEYDPNVKRLINNSKVSDHHAIIPTAEITKTDINSLTDGQKNVLMLISAKLITAAAPPHTYEEVKVTVNCENTDFFATGKTVIEQGFKELEKQIKAKLKGGAEKEEKETTLPEVTENETFENVKSSKSEHYTSPPKPYTEDTLLSAMETAGNSDYDENSDVEKKGLGTPATRAGIIENLVKREFVARNKKQLTATQKGINLIDVLPDTVTSPKLTADWETRLQSIEKGKEDSEAFMSDIIGFIRDTVAKYSSRAENTALAAKRELIGKCPICGKNVVEYPKSYSCESGKDGCGFTIWKTIAGKAITVENARELIQNKKTSLIKGFTNKENKTFDAFIKMNDEYKLVFEFPKPSDRSIGKCPICGKNVVEYPKSFSCESGKDGCGFTVWKNIAGKTITQAQAAKLIDKGRTDLIKGFTSKSGKQFDAYLVFGQNHKIEFEFNKKK